MKLDTTIQVLCRNGGTVRKHVCLFTDTTYRNSSDRGKQCRLNKLAPVLFCRDLYLCVSYRMLMEGMIIVYVRVSLSHNLIVTHRQMPVSFFVALSCADKGG